MKFTETKLKGAYVVEIEPYEDQRGFFSRTYCEEEFEALGIIFRPVQANLSGTQKKGTIRGPHFQVDPAKEPKLVRAIRGSIYDVIIDMRPDSPTYLDYFGIELSATNHKAIYIPDMFAHGYQALEDDVEIFYMVGERYTPGCERGFRFDDPSVNIQWPLDVSVVSEKDLMWEPLGQ